MDWRSVASEAAGFVRRIGVGSAAVLLGALAAIVVAAFLAGVRHGSPEPIDLPPAAGGAPLPVATTQPTTVRVHLAGAVTEPGLYEVPSSYRVGDLLDAAGGTAPDAHTAAVNLAERVRDGQQIYVPTSNETASGALVGGAAGASGAQSSGPLDVNSATASQLEELPGIGPSLATAIVAYRAEHGPFGSLEALEDVPGIGPSKLEQLRAHARA